MLARSFLSPIELLHSLYELPVGLRYMRYLDARYWPLFFAFGYFNNWKTEKKTDVYNRFNAFTVLNKTLIGPSFDCSNEF